MGEQWVKGKGGSENGPDVCCRVTSLLMASETPVGFSRVDSRFRGLELVSANEPLNPMSKPWVKP